MPATELDQIVNLCKRRGFVYPSAEIYGGFRSSYDYGPLGSLMLRNVKDAWVRSMVLRDIKIELKGSIFVFPPWMAATVALFTVLVTTVAAVYPARHAARIDPVTALRHE